MKSFVAIAALVALLPGLYLPQTGGANPPSSISSSAKAFNAENAWNRTRGAIASRYYDRDAQKEKMNALFDKYADKAKATKTPDEFRDVVEAMIRDFGDSHFDFYTKSDQGFYIMQNLMTDKAEEMPEIGVWFKKIGDSWGAQMVLNDFPAAAADIRKGDLFKTINGKPFSPVESLREFVGKKAQIVISRNGKEMTKEVDVESSRVADMFLKASQRSVKTIEYNGKKYGYMHLWTMIPRQDFKDAVSAAISRNMNTDGFIFDIRDGFGGRPEGFGDQFFVPAVEVQYKSSTINMKQVSGYGKPLMLLINEGSRSAKEVYSQIMKTTKRATLIGKTTAGHVLGTSPMPIEDWAMLEIPMVDVIVGGVRLEGVGVSPDIKVDPEYDGEGNDLVIKRALEELGKAAKH